MSKEKLFNFVKSENFLFVFSLVLFIIITFPQMITHIPCMDEILNYCRAKVMTLDNLSHILATEGHFILWYLFLLPFAKFNLYYPYPMLIINYIFALSSIIVLWKKAPFDNIFKCLITFSFMMTTYFAIVARCYSIGVLCLFLLAAMYKKQLKRPILYSLLLGITMNTSFMAIVLALGLSLIFTYNILKELFFVKNKKTIKLLVGYISAVILLFVFVAFAICPFFISSFGFEEILHMGLITGSHNYLNLFISTFVPIQHSFSFFLSYIFVLIYLLFVGKGKISKFYLLFTIMIFFLFEFFIYSLNPYHKFFLFLTIIMVMWIQNEKERYKKGVVYFIFSLTILLYTPYNLEMCFPSQKSTNLFIIKNIDKFSDSMVIIPDSESFVLARDIMYSYKIKGHDGVSKLNLYSKNPPSPYNNLMKDDFIINVKMLAENTDKKVFIITKEEINQYPQIDTDGILNIYSVK